MLLGDTLQILAWNPAAERLLAQEDALRVEAGRLSGRCARSDAALQQALHTLAIDGVSTNVSRPATTPSVLVGIPLVGQYLPLMLCFLATRPRDQPRKDGEDVAAMLLIQHPAHRLQVDPAMLEMAFALTVAEARIAALLAEGQDPADIARGQRVALSTVRKHVMAIYRKLGVRRLQEFMALIGSCPWTVLGSPEPRLTRTVPSPY